MLRAYFQEFTEADDVVLVIKTQSFHSGDNFEAKVKDEIRRAQDLAPGKPARFKLLATDLKLKELPRLYRAADAFVLPSRGEGWGRPHVEAMAMGLPVIATNWSGSTEFLLENVSLPLRIEGLEPVEGGLEGHQWAVPSENHLRELMRWVAEHRTEAHALGEADQGVGEGGGGKGRGARRGEGEGETGREGERGGREHTPQLGSFLACQAARRPGPKLLFSALAPKAIRTKIPKRLQSLADPKRPKLRSTGLVEWLPVHMWTGEHRISLAAGSCEQSWLRMHSQSRRNRLQGDAVSMLNDKKISRKRYREHE